METQQVVSESAGNQPEKKFRAGAVSATIWRNAGQNQQGEAVEYRTISLDRVYKDRDGNWKNTSSLRVNDLPKATIALQKAYEYLVIGQDTLNGGGQ
ncbi:MAG: hypothetical protein CMH61_01680 [Nanoarchaeota archaeon]|nr:hypothetical protein [Nanoarchaeota archaeon]|tara:strand:+ start:837 stop:1127 length:291 start_codon:yes stop_codon:yes gene_type:complete